MRCWCSSTTNLERESRYGPHAPPLRGSLPPEGANFSVGGPVFSKSGEAKNCPLAKLKLKARLWRAFLRLLSEFHVFANGHFLRPALHIERAAERFFLQPLAQ